MTKGKKAIFSISGGYPEIQTYMQPYETTEPS